MIKLPTNTQAIVDLLLSKNGEGHFLTNTNTYQLTLENSRFHFIESYTPLVPYSYGIMFSNRRYIREILKFGKFKIPEARAFSDSSLDKALSYAKSIGFPVILIRDSDTGSCDFQPIHTVTQLQEYFITMQHYHDVIHVEKLRVEKSYRIFITKDGWWNIIYKPQITIIGDGQSTIKELITVENMRRMNSTTLKTITVTKQDLNRTLSDILPTKEILELPQVNDDPRTWQDITNQSSPYWYQQAYDILQLFPHLGYLTIDLKTNDHTINSRTYVISNLFLTLPDTFSFPLHQRNTIKSAAEVIANLIHSDQT